MEAPDFSRQYAVADSVPWWFKPDPNVPSEHQHAQLRRDWCMYLDECTPTGRQLFVRRRNESMLRDYEQYLREHPSEDDSDDPVPPPKARNNNKRRVDTMSARMEEQYPLLEARLLELADETDMSFAMFKRALKRFCDLHKQ
jgi:hypothetical protein